MKYSVLRFSLLILLFIDSSSSRIVECHISTSCKMLFILYAISSVGEVVALVSQ